MVLDNYQISEIIRRIEIVFEGENPNLVLVYGDTNSTLAAAIAASKMGISVAHIEAGLKRRDKEGCVFSWRSHDRNDKKVL